MKETQGRKNWGAPFLAVGLLEIPSLMNLSLHKEMLASYIFKCWSKIVHSFFVEILLEAEIHSTFTFWAKSIYYILYKYYI